MPLTVAGVGRELTLVLGRLMELAGLHGSTSDASNPYLNAALRDGLQRMAFPLADPAGLAVTDADVAAVPPGSLRRLLEWAELYLLEMVDREWWRVEQARPPGLEIRVVDGVTMDPLSGVRSRLVARLALLREVVRTPYQPVNVPISIGPIAAPTPARPAPGPGVYPGPWRWGVYPWC